MFTGIIKDIGKIISIKNNLEGKEFEIETKKLISSINVDDSVSVNGVCLTAIKIKTDSFICQAVEVTLQKTILKNLSLGSLVNLELALSLGDRLGGHMVSGHVNGVCTISEIKNNGENREIWFRPLKSLLKYIVLEGSVTLNGISLTVADVRPYEFMVTFIPHTMKETTMNKLKNNDELNIEVDMMAKYLENFVRYENFLKNEDRV